MALACCPAFPLHVKGDQTKTYMTESSILRLVYPQWQGGIVASWMPDIPADDVSRGYYLGAQLLNFLAPQNGQKTAEIPISLDINDRAEEKGINSRAAIVRQTQAALDILRDENPDKIVTLGGDCAVSVAPFTWLFSKYQDDVAVVWIDAHPDVNLPYDEYKGYHAMALTACLVKSAVSSHRSWLPAVLEAGRLLSLYLRV